MFTGHARGVFFVCSMLAVPLVVRGQELGMSLLGVVGVNREPSIQLREPSDQLTGLTGAVLTAVISAGHTGSRVTVVSNAAYTGTSIQLHTHFAGDHDALPPGARTLPGLIADVWVAHPEVVFLFPDGNGAARGGGGRWSGVKDLGQVERDALATRSPAPTVTRRVVSAFSGGGYAVVQLLAGSMRAPERLSADQVVLMDTPTDELRAILRTRKDAGAPRYPTVYIWANTEMTRPTDRERAELGLAQPTAGIFANGTPSPDSHRRHYQARDDYFGRYHGSGLPGRD